MYSDIIRSAFPTIDDLEKASTPNVAFVLLEIAKLQKNNLILSNIILECAQEYQTNNPTSIAHASNLIAEGIGYLLSKNFVCHNPSGNGQGDMITRLGESIKTKDDIFNTYKWSTLY